jgi:hypothetical protein
MSQLKTLIKSGSQLISGERPVERVVIGTPGSPSDLIIYKGKIYVYGPLSQTLIDGGVIASDAIAAHAVTASKIKFTNQKFIHTLVWTATDYNTASWGAGVIKFADGTSPTINAGNTGNITAKNYIYYNGTATLQKTIYYNTAIGGNNIPLAIVEPSVDTDKKCTITSFIGSGTIIDGSVITTGKIQNSNGSTYFDLNNNVFIINDGDDDRVLIGKIGTSTYGMKVSKEGYDVKTCDDDQLNFSSEFNTLKIKTSGTLSVPYGYDNSAYVAHNMSYIPCAFVVRKLDTNKYGVIGGSPYAVSEDNLTIYKSGLLHAEVQYFRYYIFYEELVT